MGIIDKYRFEHQGNFGCSNSDYHLRRTTCCESYCVEDDELSDLYLDPSDLSKRISLLTTNYPVPCPFCGSLQWDLADEVLDFGMVPDNWKWACFS